MCKPTRLRGSAVCAVSLVDCLTRAWTRPGLQVLGARRRTIRCWSHQPRWHAATRARLRRRKSAFGFHLIAANSRPETEDPVHVGHRGALPLGCDGTVARRELPQRAEMHRTDQRRGLGADLLADQPVLRWRIVAADGVRGRRDAL